jgi:hypothetical protein
LITKKSKFTSLGSQGVEGVVVLIKELNMLQVKIILLGFFVLAFFKNIGINASSNRSARVDQGKSNECISIVGENALHIDCRGPTVIIEPCSQSSRVNGSFFD